MRLLSVTVFFIAWANVIRTQYLIPNKRDSIYLTSTMVGAILNLIINWMFGEKIGNGWKKILWYSGKMAFIFSISIEMLQLLLRLGTFQLSDIFYNTVGGLIGGVCYFGVMKARKRL